MEPSLSGPVRSPRGDLLLSTVADKALILDRAGARAHLINASALWVWDLIDGSRSVEDITRLIADEGGLDPAMIRGDIATAVETFVDADLLEHGDSVVGPGAVHQVAPSAAPTTAAIDGWPCTIGPYSAIGFRFAIGATDTAIADAVAPLLAGLADAADPIAGYAIAGSDADGAAVGTRRYEVRLDDHVLASSVDLGVVTDALLVDINRRAIERASDCLVFHAGAVDLAGVVVLPAASGSGKSTLTAALVARGGKYLSDEAAVIDPVSLLVQPYRKPLALSDSSMAALSRSLAPVGAGSTSPPDGRVGAKTHVAVDRVGQGSPGPTPLAAIIFPMYSPDGTTVLEPLAPEDALVALVPCTFAATWEVDGALERVVAMVESVPAYRLTFTDLDDAVALVHQAVGNDRGDA